MIGNEDPPADKAEEAKEEAKPKGGGLGEKLIIGAISATAAALSVWIFKRTVLKEDGRRLSRVEEEVSHINGYLEGQSSARAAPTWRDLDAEAVEIMSRGRDDGQFFRALETG